MKDERGDVRVVGFLFTLASAIFWIVAFDTGWNQSGKVVALFGLAFGILGVGSLWKPDSMIGQIAMHIAENYREQRKVNRTDTQEMSDSSEGKQVMATGGSKVDMSTHYHAPPKSEDVSEGEDIIDTFESFLMNIEVYRGSDPIIKEKILNEIKILAEILKEARVGEPVLDESIVNVRILCENVLNSIWGGDAESLKELLEKTSEIETEVKHLYIK